MIDYYKKTIRDKNVREEKRPTLGSWISVVSPTEKEIEEIVKYFSLPNEFITASVDKEEPSRIDQENGIILFIFKIPIKEETSEIFSTIPLGVILTENNIITVLLKDHPILSDFIENRVKNFATSTKTRFLLQLFHRINFYFLTYLAFLEREISQAEAGLLSSFENKEIIRLLGFQKALTYFNTAVLMNNNVLEKISKGNIVRLYEEDQEFLEDTIIENRQALGMINIYSNILANTMDAYASIVSNNLNVVMKFLASVTIIVSLPAIISSIYGMNIRLPFQEHPLIFLILILFSGLSMLILALFFAKKKFL